MGRWSASATKGLGGRFAIEVTGWGMVPVDISTVRGVPVQIDSYSSADPFGDAAAQLSFPMLTVLDDPSSPELSWLTVDSLVDIWWVPAMAKPADWNPAPLANGYSRDAVVYENELTGQADVIAPMWTYEQSGGVYYWTGTRRGIKVFEGFIASIAAASSGGLSVQCQGALLQADHYKAKPFYPPNPQTLESLIMAVFDNTARPNLRTQPPMIVWPTGWSLRAPAFTGTSNTFDPNVSPGTLWTGYTTRNTGSWDASLTSFVQNLLAVMLVKPGSGVPAGDQWTLRQARYGDVVQGLQSSGRQPYLCVRSRDTAPSFVLWAGAPGVEVDMTRDGTQKEDVIYGTGTDVAGTTWRNAVIAADGSRTDYLPLAYERDSYPTAGNPLYHPTKMMRESYIQFGTGFAQTDATSSAEQMIARDSDPGWSGTITLSVDPSETLSRWQIFAGMTMRLLGFMGSGAGGWAFHIASVEADPNSGTVTLTVDTRYRDLLTLNEAIARTRDPLTPAKLLQLNMNSVTIEDIQAPWDYSAGSGYVPKAALALYANKPTSSLFPYSAWVKANPPVAHPSWYVTVKASASQSKDRWTGPVPILMAEKGTIRRSEFFCVDKNGNLLPIQYSISLYYASGVNYSFMPTNGNNNYSPFIPGAFESIDPTTGQPWAKPGLAPDQSLVIGWGNYDQPAGYWPGLYSAGAKATGLLVDESTWNWDCSANEPNYDHLAKAGKEAASVITLYLMAYAEYTETVYIGGRLYRQEPGTDS